MKRTCIISLLLISLHIALFAQHTDADGVAAEKARISHASETGRIDLANFSRRNNQAYQVPTARQDGLLVEHINNAQLSAEKMLELIRIIEVDNLNWFNDPVRIQSAKKGSVDSFLLYKDGKLIIEEYFADAAWDKPHFQMSITKSVVAYALGVAIAQKSVHDESDYIVDYLPELKTCDLPDLAHSITIADALSMRSGIRLDDEFSITSKLSEHTCIPSVLTNCTVLKPGEQYKYQGVDPEIINHIIYNTTGYSLEEYVKEYLFEPLGIIDFSFEENPCGLSKAAAGLKLRSRDMLKLGILTLNKGQWNAQQVIPEDWVIKATTPKVNNGKNQYGFYWWQHQVNYHNRSYNIISARGALGQFIYIIPELNAVAVFTGYGTRKPFNFLEEYIVPALAGV